jgi:hypothetical protein|tara:strand:+ start:831 stop:1004 length:174 start_codon:yes stop_codon:yes gene_type:complete
MTQLTFPKGFTSDNGLRNGERVVLSVEGDVRNNKLAVISMSVAGSDDIDFNPDNDDQ